MKYKNVLSAVFLSRPNRFTAMVEIEGRETCAHVKNTGRCRELLIPGARVILEKSDNPKRKTEYDIIAVYKGERLVNIDSFAPNKIFCEYANVFFENPDYIKPEKTYRSSRFDFYIEKEDKKIFLEVKGVTLEESGVVMFPDAPTERGVKHIRELCMAKEEGYEAYIIFIIQLEDVRYFTPNIKTHREFSEALKNAQRKGVNIRAFSCRVLEDEIYINGEEEVRIY